MKALKMRSFQIMCAFQKSFVILNYLFFSFFVMSIPCNRIARRSSSVQKTCRVCHRVKHISAFTKSVLNYCNSVCNICSLQKVCEQSGRSYFCC